MNEFKFHLPVTVRCGPGALDHLAEAVAGRPVILIHHPNAYRSGALERLENRIGPDRLASLSHADGLPTMSEAERLCGVVWALVASISPDAVRATGVVLVAYGGGATIDLAKAACHQPRDRRWSSLADWIRGQQARPAFDPIELIAIPTTAGTGSEVTCWATLWDLDQGHDGRPNGVKRSLESEAGYPRLALVDGAECLTCPTQVTRDSGLDALAHSLEAIWNRNATAVSDALAHSAATEILALLPLVLAHPDQVLLRQKMSRAALMAGLAFSQTRTALAHALSYPLTAEHSVAHGLACAVWLPIAWELAEGRSTDRDRLLRSIFPGERLPATALRNWLDRLGVPHAEAYVPRDEIAQRVRDALDHPRGRNFIGAAA